MNQTKFIKLYGFDLFKRIRSRVLFIRLNWFHIVVLIHWREPAYKSQTILVQLIQISSELVVLRGFDPLKSSSSD